MPYMTQVAEGKREQLSLFLNDYYNYNGKGIGYSVLNVVNSFIEANGIKISYEITKKEYEFNLYSFFCTIYF